jgi:hypothetical protein
LTSYLTAERVNLPSANIASKFFPLHSLALIHLNIFNREAHEKNPATFPTGIQWSYEPSTGTIGLRKHIKNLHLELYKKLCIEHSIQPSEAIVEKATVDEAPVLSATQEPFNKDSLLCYICNFVIADDQVDKLNSISFTDWSF